MPVDEKRILAAILYTGWHASKPPEEKLNFDHEEFLKQFFKFEQTFLRRSELREH